MDNVMDALLRSLAEVVPYSCARVLVPEGGPHWLALGERSLAEPKKKSWRPPLTLMDNQCPLVRRLSDSKKSILIPDTATEKDWQTFKGHKNLRSWLSVPLVATGEYLGFLSVGHTEPNRLTEDHLRRAELLAIPAAAAIENARLYARAEIFASELEKRLSDLQVAEKALLEAQQHGRISEDRFQKVFRSSPVPFSITTCKEGKFLEVDAAFEHCYGYSREDLLGGTVHELRIWEDLQLVPICWRSSSAAVRSATSWLGSAQNQARSKSQPTLQTIFNSTGNRAFSRFPEMCRNAILARAIDHIPVPLFQIQNKKQKHNLLPQIRCFRETALDSKLEMLSRHRLRPDCREIEAAEPRFWLARTRGMPRRHSIGRRDSSRSKH
jgi:PAS domain-containing protein